MKPSKNSYEFWLVTRELFSVANRQDHLLGWKISTIFQQLKRINTHSMCMIPEWITILSISGSLGVWRWEGQSIWGREKSQVIWGCCSMKWTTLKVFSRFSFFYFQLWFIFRLTHCNWFKSERTPLICHSCPISCDRKSEQLIRNLWTEQQQEKYSLTAPIRHPSSLRSPDADKFVYI